MSVCVEIPFHETIVSNLNCASADCFLEQYSPGIFFIREQFIDSFPVPFGSACPGWDVSLLQTRSDFSKAVASQVSLKYSAYHLELIRIYGQLIIRADFISITFAAAIVELPS